MAVFIPYLVLLVLMIFMNPSICVDWERLRCSADATQKMPEGIVSNKARFPWLGIVQHNFYIAGEIHFAVTGAVLIHPAFAIAPAEDIAKINNNDLANNTKLILWGSQKYAMDIKDYILHPEYHKQVTYASLALLDLVAWGDSPMNDWKAPVLPICMPVKGTGVFQSLYAVKMTDATGPVEKEIVKMKYVDEQDCEEFYYKAELSYGKMNPVNPLCAVSEHATAPCVWDGGTALITRQSWGYWKLLGFAVRGPGCGAPTRFLNIHDYLPWINDVITRLPRQDNEDTYALGLRRVSPVKLIMYKADRPMPKGTGQCNKKTRGGILYKDSSEVLTNKNFVQGFFFVVISMIAEVSCLEVQLEVESRTNAAVWLEHNCHGANMAMAYGQKLPMREKAECFIYFKTSAFIEFRFFFSFKALIQVALYGQQHKERRFPNPFKSTQYTTAWWPTPDRLKFYYYVPANLWWYSL